LLSGCFVSRCSTVVGVTTAVSPVVAPLLLSVAVVGAGDRVGTGVATGVVMGVRAVDTGAEVEVGVGAFVSDLKAAIGSVLA
jgi:hypothetical protein